MRFAEKRKLNLARRRRDYDAMIAKSGDYKGYKRPGSNKKV